MVYTLAPKKLAGWVTEPSKSAAEFLLPDSVALPTYGRLTGRGGDANMEVVLQAKPDIVLDIGTINDTYIDLANKVQEQTGIPYILIDGSFDKTAGTYRLLGELLGEQARAELLAAYADKTLAQLADTLSKVPADQRPTAYYGRGDEGLETGLSGSINVEILAAAGATNVAAAAGEGGLTDVSLEQILAWNPDVVIAARASFAEAALANPDWAPIKAVADKAVYVAPSLPFGWIDTRLTRDKDQNEAIVRKRAAAGQVRSSLVGFSGMPVTVRIGEHTFYRSRQPAEAVPVVAVPAVSAVPAPGRSAPADDYAAAVQKTLGGGELPE